MWGLESTEVTLLFPWAAQLQRFTFPQVSSQSPLYCISSYSDPAFKAYWQQDCVSMNNSKKPFLKGLNKESTDLADGTQQCGLAGTHTAFLKTLPLQIQPQGKKWLLGKLILEKFLI